MQEEIDDSINKAIREVNAEKEKLMPQDRHKALMQVKPKEFEHFVEGFKTLPGSKKNSAENICAHSLRRHRTVVNDMATNRLNQGCKVVDVGTRYA